MKNRDINVLVQYGAERHPELRDIPTILEIAKTPEGRAAIAFYIGGAELGRSLAAPPGLPAERVKLLRAAFDAMLKDRDFLAEIEKSGQEFYPASGDQVQKLIAATANAPRNVVELHGNRRCAANDHAACRHSGCRYPRRRPGAARRRRRRSGAALRDECVAWLPRAGRTMLPAIDAITRRWLQRSASPYVGEIATIATTLGYSGIWFLNGCYEWGCTALACEQDGAPWLARTLDWPFPGLGRYLEVARMQGPAGDFDNVGWPGYVGALTASAPGRFAAAINQAPLRRRTRHPWLRPYDMALNAARTWRIRFIPPDHLLRNVFETCASYGEARHRLETTPIARPVIYSLVGCEAGERCVIERTEEGFSTRIERHRRRQ